MKMESQSRRLEWERNRKGVGKFKRGGKWKWEVVVESGKRAGKSNVREVKREGKREVAR